MRAERPQSIIPFLPAQFLFKTDSKGRYGMKKVEGKTGMEPKINARDVIVIDYEDTEIKDDPIVDNEDRIYLVRYKNQMVLRHVELSLQPQEDPPTMGYAFSRNNQTLFAPYGETSPIIGRVVLVCRKI